MTQKGLVEGEVEEPWARNLGRGNAVEFCGIEHLLGQLSGVDAHPLGQAHDAVGLKVGPV